MDANSYQDVSALLKSLTSYDASRDKEEHHQAFASGTRASALSEGGAQDMSYEESKPPNLENFGRYQAPNPSSTRTPLNVAPTASGTSYERYDLPEPLEQRSSRPQETATQQSATSAPEPTSPGKVDPRTITDWPTALRYVFELTRKNEAITDNIRRMIKNQHVHEKRWSEERKTLLQKQQARLNGRKELNDVLRFVGAKESLGDSEIENAQELKQYDLKVHSVMTKMAETIDLQLMTLGIPFFGTKEHLILAEDTRIASKNSGIEPKEKTGNATSSQITKRELKRLQQKMMSFLEDLCGE